MVSGVYRIKRLGLLQRPGTVMFDHRLDALRHNSPSRSNCQRCATRTQARGNEIASWAACDGASQPDVAMAPRRDQGPINPITQGPQKIVIAQVRTGALPCLPPAGLSGLG
jgi:hypothetical protein